MLDGQWVVSCQGLVANGQGLTLQHVPFDPPLRDGTRFRWLPSLVGVFAWNRPLEIDVDASSELGCPGQDMQSLTEHPTLHGNVVGNSEGMTERKLHANDAWGE